MEKLSMRRNSETYEALYAAYSEKHRHYHTTVHIAACLTVFDEFIEIASNPGDVEIAIWFHDAIYKPLSKNNEANSANWARRFIVKNDGSETKGDSIHRLIMATLHNTLPTDADAQLLVDVDISILGSNPDTYEEFEANVRREYRCVPGPLFRNERRKILQSFLDRETIYSTVALRDAYEDQARANLASAIKSL